MKEEKIEKFFEMAFKGEPTTGLQYVHHPSQELLMGFITKQRNEQEMAILGTHIATCGQCAKRTATLRKERAIAASRPTPYPFLSLLRRVGKGYLLKASFIEELFDLIEEQLHLKMPLRVPAVRGRQAAEKERRFRTMLRRLLPHLEDYDRLLKGGNRKSLRERLLADLGDEQAVDDILAQLK